jgi:hypothetical protein
MTTLVSQNPEASCKKTLNETVESPKRISNCLGWNGLWGNIVVEDVESDGETDYVSEDISEAAKSRSLEAMSWDSITNFLDGIVREVEFVSIGIYEGRVLVLRQGGK